MDLWGTVRSVLKILVTYVGGQLLIALIMIGYYAVAFGLLKLPVWFLLAPVCGLMHIIPVVGSLIALCVPLLAVVIAGTSWEQVAWILGVFGLAQMLEALLLTPLIHGKSQRLHPGLVFVTVLAATALFGFFGALVAVPVLSAAMLVWRIASGRGSNAQN